MQKLFIMHIAVCDALSLIFLTNTRRLFHTVPIIHMHNTMVKLIIGTDRPEKITSDLGRTICHSSSIVVDTFTGNKIDLFKF